MSPLLQCFFGFEAVLPKVRNLYAYYRYFSAAQPQIRGDDSSDGRVVIAFASRAVDSGLIPS